MSNSILEIKDLNVRFNGFAVNAVSDVNIVVPKGKRVGIIGESGSGKSVTAMSVLRLNDEKAMKYGQNSEIWFKGENLLVVPPKKFAKIRGSEIAMIFQDPMSTLNPVFTVGRQIVDVLRTHCPQSYQEARERVIDSLTSVGIRESAQIFEQYPHQLSGGMRQRVMIAMAISSSPSVLIADEPTSALDVTVQASVLETLGSLADELEMSVLMITHDMGVVARFCDEVYVMNRGTVVEYGLAADILTNPVHSYTQKLLASVPRVHPAKY
jgi:ABC-type dipeptide/oligopeptide/nickel transport system ATPase component